MARTTTSVFISISGGFLRHVLHVAASEYLPLHGGIASMLLDLFEEESTKLALH